MVELIMVCFFFVLSFVCYIFFFFFFQAEDGIRDIGVTGVQNVCSSDLFSCFAMAGTASALATNPSRWSASARVRRGRSEPISFKSSTAAAFASALAPGRAAWCTRSEERRGGKECRSRWSPYHLKNTKDN